MNVIMKKGRLALIVMVRGVTSLLKVRNNGQICNTTNHNAITFSSFTIIAASQNTLLMETAGI